MFSCVRQDEQDGRLWFRCTACGEEFEYHEVTPLTIDEVVCNSVRCLRKVAIDRTIALYNLKYRVAEVLESE